jgi:hypothetical protein
LLVALLGHVGSNSDLTKLQGFAKTDLGRARNSETGPHQSKLFPSQLRRRCLCPQTIGAQRPESPRYCRHPLDRRVPLADKAACPRSSPRLFLVPFPPRGRRLASLECGVSILSDRLIKTPSDDLLTKVLPSSAVHPAQSYPPLLLCADGLTQGCASHNTWTHISRRPNVGADSQRPEREQPIPHRA